MMSVDDPQRLIEPKGIRSTMIRRHLNHAAPLLNRLVYGPSNHPPPHPRATHRTVDPHTLDLTAFRGAASEAWDDRELKCRYDTGAFASDHEKLVRILRDLAECSEVHLEIGVLSRVAEIIVAQKSDDLWHVVRSGSIKFDHGEESRTLNGLRAAMSRMCFRKTFHDDTAERNEDLR